MDIGHGRSGRSARVRTWGLAGLVAAVVLATGAVLASDAGQRWVASLGAPEPSADFCPVYPIAVPAPLLAGVAGNAIAQAPGRKLGVALCGLGSLSTNQIAPALLKTRNCRLAGIVTGTPAKAEEWKKKYNLPAKSVYDYKTMNRMADNKEIDIVYVVTPNALHLEHALAAAAAGKHVFCEKPMEITVERCQQMIDAVKKAGKMLGVGYRCQFEPNNLECVRLAKEKVLGEVKIIDANFGFAAGGLPLDNLRGFHIVVEQRRHLRDDARRLLSGERRPLTDEPGVGALRLLHDAQRLREARDSCFGVPRSHVTRVIARMGGSDLGGGCPR